jgi:hypothetical protein
MAALVGACPTRRQNQCVEPITVLDFAALARELGQATRAAGLLVPAFRSPPRRADRLRTIRRYPGGATVSIRLRGRARPQVLDDMVDGVLAANSLSGAAAARVRGALMTEIELMNEIDRARVGGAASSASPVLSSSVPSSPVPAANPSPDNPSLGSPSTANPAVDENTPGQTAAHPMAA